MTKIQTNAVADLSSKAPINSPVFTGTIQIPDGTAVAPSIVFSSDVNTGIFKLAAQNFAIACNGFLCLQIAPNRFNIWNVAGSQIMSLGSSGGAFDIASGGGIRSWSGTNVLSGTLVAQYKAGAIRCSLQVFANNAAAITGGLTVGDFYRTGADPDTVCVVH